MIEDSSASNMSQRRKGASLSGSGVRKAPVLDPSVAVGNRRVWPRRPKYWCSWPLTSPFALSAYSHPADCTHLAHTPRHWLYARGDSDYFAGVTLPSIEPMFLWFGGGDNHVARRGLFIVYLASSQEAWTSSLDHQIGRPDLWYRRSCTV